ncbi:MAG: D-glycero-beta-D-manno-heptose 1-phosphate adenylyltransferase [Cyclobacteriaceae bacterium]|nr:D-glycero-beta-D-manno-heptose 1-phosphate adenylyltransferase [Cyclobacteriaceae bacterium HetDA_MAG_MS6]
MKPTKLKIVTKKEAEILRKRWRNEGQKIVFTNGCFDVLHLGHVDYLEKARNLGGKLIVGLNDDSSVSRLKGVQRPINNQLARSRMMAALDVVDAVIIFQEDTPEKLIKFLLPDILVKGKDYDISNIVGSEIVLQNGGIVETIDLVDGYSTTLLIDKLKNS